jgi:hypothetical protein
MMDCQLLRTIPLFFLDHDLEQAKKHELLLCVLNNCPFSKSTFIKVKSFVMEKQKILRTNTSSSSDVMEVNTPSDI